MPNPMTLADAKSELKRIIRYHADRGFWPYNACNQVCYAMIKMVEDSKRLDDRKVSFDMGPMYGEKEYPDRYLITQAMMERLQGVAAADQYRMEHIHIPEIRMLVVERALPFAS